MVAAQPPPTFTVWCIEGHHLNDPLIEFLNSIDVVYQVFQFKKGAVPHSEYSSFPKVYAGLLYLGDIEEFDKVPLPLLLRMNELCQEEDE